jgi:hypothetical protein
MTGEVRLVQAFAHDMGGALAERAALNPDDSFTVKETQEIRRVAAMFTEVIHAATKKKGEEVRVTLSARVGALVYMLGTTMKYRGFLAEMALSYLVSYFEAFVKDYVLTIMVADPRMLRSSATITFEELSAHRSVKSVWRTAAEKEADTLGYGSIDDTAAYFKKRFMVDLTTFENWTLLRELVYRRNLIVHNRSRVNDAYRRKIGFTGKASVLATDLRYVSSGADMIVEFFAFLHTLVTARHKR